MIVFLVLMSVTLGLVLWHTELGPKLRYSALLLAWLATAGVALWRGSTSGGGGQAPALLVAYSFPFLWVFFLARVSAIERRPWLFLVLVPPLFLTAFFLGTVTLVSSGLLIP